MRIGSCDKNPIVTRMMMNLDFLFSLVGGRSTKAVVSGVLHIGADVVVPQAVSVCECSFSSPMRLRVSRGSNLRVGPGVATFGLAMRLDIIEALLHDALCSSSFIHVII
uniref:Uncharacterized protein n=1 Tax=Ananas comosus var. bracteatus TaxID=296719 RepID=A0A6V7PZL5_ANACO|nr:unnamed protein product [Ananas comosus var. bracteatus]